MNKQSSSTKRLYYIDYLRIFLSFLMVAHHLALANGASGNWYTAESNLAFCYLLAKLILKIPAVQKVL